MDNVLKSVVFCIVLCQLLYSVCLLKIFYCDLEIRWKVNKKKLEFKEFVNSFFNNCNNILIEYNKTVSEFFESIYNSSRFFVFYLLNLFMYYMVSNKYTRFIYFNPIITYYFLLIIYVSICVLCSLPFEFYTNFYINYELEANPSIINMKSLPPSGPSGPLGGGGNSGFNGFPGPGGNGQPNKLLDISTQISNKFQDELLEKRNSCPIAPPRAEMIPQPLPKGCLHIGSLHMQEEALNSHFPGCTAIPKYNTDYLAMKYDELPIPRRGTVECFPHNDVVCEF